MSNLPQRLIEMTELLTNSRVGAIISAAKWCIYENQFTEEEMNKRIKVDWHSDEDKNEWSEHLIHYVHQHRLKRTEGAPCAGKKYNSFFSTSLWTSKVAVDSLLF